MVTASSYQQAIWAHLRTPDHGVVEALAGTGKTTTLVQGLEHLPGRAVLYTSFGRDIVSELKAVVPAGRAHVQTLNGAGQALILRHIRPANRDPDRYKLHRHVKAALKAAGISTKTPEGKDSTLVKDLAEAASWAKAFMMATPAAAAGALRRFDVRIPRGAPAPLLGGPDETETESLPPAAELDGQLLIDVLNRCATDTTSFDFDDQVWLPLVWNLPFQSYDDVLVDEAQDLTFAQLTFTRQLARTGRILAVGDRHQALYGFRGADSDAMGRIVSGLSAKTLPLPICYRCGTDIVKEAQAYVPALQPAPGAPPGLVQRMKLEDLVEMVEPGDFVLSRTNAPLARIGADIKMAGKPILQLGKDMSVKLLDLLRRSKQSKVDDLKAWLTNYLAKRTAELAEDKDALDDVKDTVETVLAFTAGHKHGMVSAIAEEIRALYSDDARSNAVVLSTVHRAKGKQAQRVYLVWGTFLKRPGTAERSIAYVATTRAQSELYFVDGDVSKS